VAVQEAEGKEVNWIIETKGRVWEGTRAKDEAIGSWCRRVSEQTGNQWRFIRINQKDVDLPRAITFATLMNSITKKVPSILDFGG
jgi:type III restriction enzyme